MEPTHGLGTAEAIDETYQIIRFDHETEKEFHTRVANEIKTMDVIITGTNFIPTCATIWYHERISNY